MEKFKYYLPLRVRFAETDLQGHVFFGNYLIYFDEAWTGYTHAIGCTYQNLLAVGIDMYYIHSECDYHTRAFFEDELHIHARVGKIGNSSVTFEFAALKPSTDEPVATGSIVAVTVDLKTRKPVRVPDIFRDAVTRYENSV